MPNKHNAERRHHILPAPAVVERAAIAGRARARKRTADVLLAGVSGEQLAKLDRLLAVDPTPGATPLAWLRNTPVSPKADNIRELLDRLRSVRAIGLPADVASRPQFRSGDAARFVQNCTVKAFSENSSYRKPLSASCLRRRALVHCRPRSASLGAAPTHRNIAQPLELDPWRLVGIKRRHALLSLMESVTTRSV
jgi:hypothetical protein